ncbi:hypothetical protein GM658_26295 [Pseudoduganella eburnea]|uniref:O-GlcNAc transferase C-terminal domain-containing protein n=1 Tax=Massilia eburnea TaxID=1776165 RepID=A0A6L6QPI7_9BURK|nr:hypothetical protein [Massilia eburnea]MTW14130.1 hypothetical protein [Massilia eburnea]
MPGQRIEFLHPARRISGKEEFHRYLFEAMLGGQWRRQAVALPPEDEAALLELLGRWVREAGVKDELGVLRLLAVRGVLRDLVGAAGARVKPFLMDVLAMREEDLLHPQQMPGWKQLKLAALGDASLLSAEALAEWSGHDPIHARLAAIACLDTCPLDAGAARATAAAGRWLMSVAPVKMPLRYLEQCHVSAFHVSYLADPGRHDFKRAIVRHAGAQLPAVPPASARAPVAGKPRLTIVGELLFPGHAMFRCYAGQLAGLKEHFHVTLLTDQPTRCAEHARFSDEQLYFPPQERDVARLAQMVASTAPDLLFYPSIGMCYWTFVLSMLRLAPLQLMSVGHPAPSCSGQIDGTLVFHELATAPMPEYGKMACFDAQALPSPPPGGWHARPRPAGEVRTVAVNAARMKLTPDFLDVVAQVLASAPPATQLHFFPNASGAELLALRRELQGRFPQACVHPTMGYAGYMDKLAQADVILQSFPFGGTNTAMDALALGIPLVCLEGGDLASKVDPLLLARAGLGELCAKDRDTYLALASQLLNSEAERARIGTLARSGLAQLAGQDAQGQTTLAAAILRAWQEQA